MILLYFPAKLECIHWSISITSSPSYLFHSLPHPHFQILVFPFEPALNLIAMAAKEASQRCRVCVCMYI